ncbi:MAG: ZIP family metal transporter [Firmicutes bacterium]|nr:ZIP family metal transporter [Bacillota bacterium]
MLLDVILIAFGAGVVGCFIGGLIGVIIKKPTKTYISLMLSFAAGAMLGVAMFKLLPESYEYGGLWAALIGTLLGVGFVFFIDLLNKRNRDEIGDRLDHYAKDVCVRCAEGEVCKSATSASDKYKLKKMGIAVFFAMMLHSLPEGIAIGAGEYLGIGLLLGVIFALHFVTEGLAIAVPMKASGMKTWKVLMFSAAAGLPAVLGAIIGYFVGINDTLLAYCFSFAAGAMLYVILGEMLPTAYKYSDRHKLITFIVIVATLLIVIFYDLLH